MSRPAAGHASRLGIWSWMLFDWAEQPFQTLLVTFIFAPYFASAVAPTPAAGQTLWGYATGFGGLAIALLSPVFGAIADAAGPRKPWIFAFSILGVAGSAALWYAVPGMANPTPILFAVAVALIGMEFSFLFVNAMMPTLVPRSELGRLSGSAWGLGYIGGLLSLVIVLGLLAGQPGTGKTLFGLHPILGLDAAAREGDRASGPLTAIWYVVFVVPMFIFTPDVERKPRSVGVIRSGIAGLGRTLRALPKERSYFAFLVSSMIYRDALNALYAFGGIYAAGVLGWSITKIGLFGIVAALIGAVGAWLGGMLDQRYGPKPVVSGCIVLLSLACILIISTTSTDVLFIRVGPGSVAPDLVFFACGGLIGAAGASIQAASRTLLVDQVEPERVTEAFGLYALSGRATSFIGPLAIAWATAASGSQRLGVTPIIVLFLLGAVLLPMVKSAYQRPRTAR
jgi:MFS transporter, UMF1 family